MVAQALETDCTPRSTLVGVSCIHMTIWHASVGEILDANAEALICSANPQLNLSGGVGGSFGLRYGPAMQEFLHDWLIQSGQRHVQPGHIVASPPCGSQFKLIVHAVAIDAFYETSPAIIRAAYDKAFAAIANASLRSVVATCLACGYGRASSQIFLNAIGPLLSSSLPGIDSVELISTNVGLIEEVQNQISRR